VSRLAWLKDEIDRLREEGLFTTIRELGGPQGATIVVDGMEVANFCSNNYLGLADDPRLVAAARDALGRYGVGPGAVRTIAGTMTVHLDLERELAAFKDVGGVISLPSGFTANLGVIPALVGDGDVIVSDELNHASIVDGVRLAKADRRIYAHRDPEALETQLRAARDGGARRVLVITDGVFSMDGDIAPLPAICDLADEYEALVMVDDAHGEGVLGRGGRGIVDHLGVQGRVHVEVGTLSKAFGVMGGYVAGEAVLADWLRQRARPFLFSSAVTPVDAAACLAAVRVLAESDALVQRLWANASRFKEGMGAAGFDLGHSETPITPVILGDSGLAQDFSRRLFTDHRVFAQAITYPTVPQGTARIRVMISAAHTDEHLDDAVTAFTAVGRELGVIG
jgi:glycine C-acetyltransferase